MKFKGIIFDMDGTIIDSNHIWKKVTREVIAQKNIQLSDELLDELEKKLHGLALHASCELIKQKTNLDFDIDEIIRLKKTHAGKLLEQHVTFIDGFVDFYYRALQKNLKMGIATNADDHTLEITKKKLDLTQFFGHHIYGISCVNNVHKPNPDIFLHAAEQLKINPIDCVAIEDSAHGVQAARDAGMFCVGINTGKNRNVLKDAHLIIDTYDELCLEKLLKK